MQNIKNIRYKDMKTTKLPLLHKHHKEKHVNWEKNYMETDFSPAIFNNELRAYIEWTKELVGPFMEIVNQHNLEDRSVMVK